MLWDYSTTPSKKLDIQITYIVNIFVIRCEKKKKGKEKFEENDLGLKVCIHFERFCCCRARGIYSTTPLMNIGMVPQQ